MSRKSRMAKFNIERAYIESYDEDGFDILIHIKQGNDHILVGKVELVSPKPWIHLQTAKNGDLMINNSAGMEDNKWNHITREIIGEIHE